MSRLIVSYSGIRGIVGESLTAAVAESYGRAFRQLLDKGSSDRGVVLIGRDTRPSGPELAQAVMRGIGPGVELVDLGVVPTPTLQHAMRPFRARGGVCVTASHNPGEWNGMKFFLGPDNTVLDGKQTALLCQLAEQDAASTGGIFSVRDAHAEAERVHLETVCSLLDLDKIRGRRFRVAVDSARGAGREITVTLLHQLGCEVIVVDAVRDSEPVPENLTALREAVVREGCDLGVAQDLDADRLALVTELGDAPGEERTLVLVLDHLLDRFGGDDTVVVKNVATTRAVDDIVRAHGAILYEARVGEINLSRALMRALRRGVTAFGGEGNGGVIYPPVSLGRDSLIGIGWVLEALAAQPAPLSKRLAWLPAYATTKVRLPRTQDVSLETVYTRVAALFPEAGMSMPDGLKLTFSDGAWLSVRPSNTEPVVRVIAEASSSAWTLEAVRRIEHELSPARVPAQS